jgi:hypothetical protein
MLHPILALTAVAAMATAAMANVVVDLNADFNRPEVLSLIDSNLPSGTSRTSGVQLSWMPWGKVPGPVKPRATKTHRDTDPVIQVSVRVHVNTPSWCLAVDGGIVYYVFPDNSEFLIKGVVDSWDTMTDNISACSGGVNDQLRKLVPTKISLIQGLVDFRLSQLPNQHFGSYFLLNNPVRLVLDQDTIVSRWSDLCMDVKGASTANGALIQQWDCNESNTQKYDKIPVVDGYFMIRNRNSGKCIAISGGGTENGALIAQYDCNTADLNHHWRSTDPGGNSVGAKWLINRRSGKCLEVPAWSTTPGTLLGQLDCVGGWKHNWYNV